MPCPACAEQKRIEDEFLTFIAESPKLSPEDEEELKNLLTSGAGLCAPHYARMVELRKRRIPKWFSEFQENKYKKLLERTNRFIDFSAWGKQKDFESLPPEDKIVWKELASTLRSSVE